MISAKITQALNTITKTWHKKGDNIMTFEKFQQLAKANCPDVDFVSKHGDYCMNPSKNTLGVKFKGNPKVYGYHGTYFQILNQLGYRCTRQVEIDAVVKQLERAKATNGRKGLFKTIDNTELIALYTEWLNMLQALPIVE